MTTEVITTDANGNYDVSKLNALRHGILSRHAILPWEEKSEYDALVTEIEEEFEPQGTIERHLVEELATVIWRKARLRGAEKAAYMQQIYIQVKRCNESDFDSSVRVALLNPHDKWRADLQSVFAKNPYPLAKQLKASRAECDTYKKALVTIKEKLDATYEQMVESLPEDIRELWSGWINSTKINDKSARYWKDAESLQTWIRDIIKWCYNQISELENRPEIKDQAIGQAFPPEETIGTFCRYETHLDRKFERTLSMLVKLQDMRKPSDAPTAH